MNSPISTRSACIIGAGPSGIFLSKFLAKQMKVDIFEKSNRILGHYNYSTDFKPGLFNKILQDKNITVHLNSEIRTSLPEGYDTYVFATGGISRKYPIDGGHLPSENTSTSIISCANNINENVSSSDSKPLGQNYLNALDVIDSYYKKTDLFRSLGDTVFIFGMGNVTMDLLNYLKKTVKNIVVLSRSNWDVAKFDNHKLADILKEYKIYHNLPHNGFDSVLRNSSTNIEHIPKLYSQAINDRAKKRRWKMLISHNSLENVIPQLSRHKTSYLQKFLDVFNTCKSGLSGLCDIICSSGKNSKADFFCNILKDQSKFILNSRSQRNPKDSLPSLYLLFNSDFSAVYDPEFKRYKVKIQPNTLHDSDVALQDKDSKGIRDSATYPINSTIFLGNSNKNIFFFVSDTVISSIGFIPFKPIIKIPPNASVYDIGWCANSVGSINDVKNDAEILSKKIIGEIFQD